MHQHQLRGFKFVPTLVLVLKLDKIMSENFHSSSKAKIIIIESDIDAVFHLIYTTIISNIQKSL